MQNRVDPEKASRVAPFGRAKLPLSRTSVSPLAPSARREPRPPEVGGPCGLAGITGSLCRVPRPSSAEKLPAPIDLRHPAALPC